MDTQRIRYLRIEGRKHCRCCFFVEVFVRVSQKVYRPCHQLSEALMLFLKGLSAFLTDDLDDRSRNLGELRYLILSEYIVEPA